MKGIYKITNNLTGDFYIGSSINIEKRIKIHKEHLNRKVHPNKYLLNVVTKYGISNFLFEILEECIEENLLEKEAFYIESLKPKYNLMPASCGRIVHSEETKKKISMKLKSKVDDSFRKRMSETNKGRKMSEESKLAISNANKGRKKIWKSGIHPSVGKPSHFRGKTGASSPSYGKKGKLSIFSKKIYQLDKDSLEIIKIWDSLTEACEGVGIKSKTDLARCATGRQKTAGGFKWKYVNKDIEEAS